MTIEITFIIGMTLLFLFVIISTGRTAYRGLKYGEIESGRGSATYSRRSQPISYWFQILMNAAICITGLRFMIIRFIPILFS